MTHFANAISEQKKFLSVIALSTTEGLSLNHHYVWNTHLLRNFIQNQTKGSGIPREGKMRGNIYIFFFASSRPPKNGDNFFYPRLANLLRTIWLSHLIADMNLGPI